MANKRHHQIKIYTFPQTWGGRLLATVVGALLLLLAIFFLTFFIIVIALLAIIMTVYSFLFARKYENTEPPDMVKLIYVDSTPEDESENLECRKDDSLLK